jgi:hypothetical protein
MCLVSESRQRHMWKFCLKEEARVVLKRAQSDLLHFTILSTQAEESPRLVIVAEPSQKKSFL